MALPVRAAAGQERQRGVAVSETRVSRGRLEIRQQVEGDAALLRLSGAIDETFSGFDLPPASHVAIELGGLTRITSYGVRQWIRGRDHLSQSAKQLYYLNCPPFFIDQLNMVLNFGGHGQVVTAFAPFSCGTCKSERWALIDVMQRQDDLAAGNVPVERCPDCKTAMQMDELPETYFGFVRTAAARALSPQVAPLLASTDLYHSAAAPAGAPAERAQIQKLVHERVTYFRIGGAIDKRFRARSMLEGVEGEVILDLRDLVSFSDDGREEWDRLRTGLKQRAQLVTLVDMPPPIIEAVAAKRLAVSGVVVYSILAPHRCDACGGTSDETLVLAEVKDKVVERVCSACGGSSKYAGKPEHLALAVRMVHGPILSATRDVIERRDDLLSRARIDAEAPAGPPEFLRKKGTILGKYEIARALSVGGMAEVFLAVQKGIGGFEKPVALKRIRKSVLERRHSAVEHFLNEAKIAATLAHPNIAQIFDVGEEEGLLYLAMEYVHGKDLRVVLRRLAEKNEKMPLAPALYVVQQIARALHHAYTTVDLNGRQLKAIHRDISPHNVLIGFDGAVKLVDFGVAVSATTAQHNPAEVAGKHNYVSPEQLQGIPLDARSDLFSLGTVLYEMLSGERPFAHATAEDTFAAVSDARFRPLSELRPDLGPPIDRLIGKLLAKHPSERLSDGNRVAEEVAAFARQSAAVLDNQWLAANMPQLFPSASNEPDFDGTERAAQTPHSDSFSLQPTGTLGHLRTPTPSALPLPPPPAPDPREFLDEQTVSRIVSPSSHTKGRSWVLFLLLLVTGAGLAVLWFRY
jgi:eukaryotic-like serine/threonine-protein kinase